MINIEKPVMHGGFFKKQKKNSMQQHNKNIINMTWYGWMDGWIYTCYKTKQNLVSV